MPNQVTLAVPLFNNIELLFLLKTKVTRVGVGADNKFNCFPFCVDPGNVITTYFLSNSISENPDFLLKLFIVLTTEQRHLVAKIGPSNLQSFLNETLETASSVKQFFGIHKFYASIFRRLRRL